MALLLVSEDKTPLVWPITTGDLKARFPNTSFPTTLPPDGIPEYGVFPLVPTALPNYDSVNYKVNEVAPILVDGNWVQQWEIVELTSDEKSSLLDAKSQDVRNNRNELLLNSDWRVIYAVEKASIDGLGIQYPQVWADYRQALRDITSQPGFPHNVTWPEEPTT